MPPYPRARQNGIGDSPDTHTDHERLAAAGSTKGCNPPTNDRFCPDGRVTREVMAAFLVRALGYTDSGGGDLFDDDDDSVFEGDIDRLGTAGVTKGCNPPTNDRYCPMGESPAVRWQPSSTELPASPQPSIWAADDLVTGAP